MSKDYPYFCFKTAQKYQIHFLNLIQMMHQKSYFLLSAFLFVCLSIVADNDVALCRGHVFSDILQLHFTKSNVDNISFS